MSVRAIDIDGDWIYGIGRSAYLSGRAEVAQSIKTRLLSFLGDCFFDLGAGVDWFNFLGSKNQIGLNLAISATILNTQNVVSINELSVTLDAQRNFAVAFSVNTSFGQIQSSLAIPTNSIALITEDGATLITEDGFTIVTG